MEFTFKHWKHIKEESHYNVNVFQDMDNRKFRVETQDDYDDAAVYEITDGKDEFVFTIPDTWKLGLFTDNFENVVTTADVDDFIYT